MFSFQNKANQSFESLRKGFKVKIGFLANSVFFLFAYSACSSGPTATETELTDEKAKDHKIERLTFVGNNSAPRLSKDGRFLVFQSSNHPIHSQSQIYELDLENKSLKRLTFQPVDNYNPFYDQSGGDFFFSSAIDELKEHANVFLKSISPQPKTHQELQEPPLELYRFSRASAELNRLTRSRLFDGYGDIDAEGANLIFSSFRNNKLALYKLNLISKKITLFSDPAENEADIEAQISPDGRSVVWVRKNLATSTSQLWVSEISGINQRPLTTAPASHRNPSWDGDSAWIVFSSDRSMANHFNLYAMKVSGECIIKLLDYSSSDAYPLINSRDNSLVFVSQLANQSQVFLKHELAPLSCKSGV